MAPTAWSEACGKGGTVLNVSVAIGVPTFRRPEYLTSLLPQLLDQIECLPSGARGEILVVDNDPERSAESVVLGLHPLINYVHEPIEGIASARQRCLDVSTRFDLLQFIDDDEEPIGDWLPTMIEAWQMYGRPAAVMGRVIPRFEVQPSEWILEGCFFDRPRYPSGTELPAAMTSNLLLDLRQIRNLGTSFDRTLGLAGGEDTKFTRSLVSAGGRIVFCDESAVTDLVPTERITREWVLRRAWFHGNSAADLRLRRSAGDRQLVTRGTLVAGGFVRTIVGLLRAGAGKIAGRLETNARGWRLVHRGLGMAAGGLGRTRAEYARDDGETS